MTAVPRVAFVLMLSVASAAAQGPLETRGAWHIGADGDGFALRTRARDASDGSFALLCRREARRFMFELKSPALASLPRGNDIRVSFKVDDDDQVWFNFATGPDGTIPIAQETAFWIIRAALFRKDAKVVAFTTGDQSWQFDLDGLATSDESLTQHCGFAPDRSPRRRR